VGEDQCGEIKMKAEATNIKMQEVNVEVEDDVIIKTEEVVSCH